MKRKINILAIEDSDDDLMLNMREIERGGYEPLYERVETAGAMHASLSAKDWDVIISDHKMPHFDSFQALEVLRESGKDIPFIIVSGTIGEETAVAAMKAGAGDYLMKNRLKRLVPAIERELAEVEVRRKQREAEERQRMSLHILELLNRPNDTRTIIGDILQYIKQETGIDAAGIRLREGDDYPFFVQSGFPAGFIERESSLCHRDETGDCIRDEEGNPELKSVCGQILMRRFGPDRSYYTESGSFWSGDLVTLLASPQATDLGLLFGDRLGSEGYRSIAIIPLSSGDEIIGLLRMNDRREGRIDGDMVRFFEGIGASIGIALKRRHLEDEIRERARIYRLITDNMSDGIWLMDMNYKYIFITPSLERARGFTMEDMNTMPMHANFTPESYSLIRRVIEEELAPERIAQKDIAISRSLDLEITRKDGSTFWGEIRFEVIRDPKGEAVAIMGVGRDISERKFAEERIKKSEARYRAVAEDAPLLICRFLPDGTITFVNDAYCRYFGKEHDELIGTDINQFKYLKDREDFASVIRSATRENPIARLENRVVAAEGSFRWVRWTGRAMFRGNKMAECQAIGEDITEEKRMTEALRESEERWRSIFENSPVGITLANLEGFFVVANHAYQEMIGYSEEELRTLTFLDITHEEDRQANAELGSRLWKGKIQQYQQQKRYRHKNGRLIWVRNTVTLVPGTASVPRFYMAITEDITERKKAEEAIRESERFALSTVNAIDANIAILDECGEIISVNSSWRAFNTANRGDPTRAQEGVNYLEVCDKSRGENAEGAAEFAAGIRAVMSGDTDSYTMESPCHSPTEQRWFVGKVTLFPGGRPIRAVISHTDITSRKLIENHIAASLREKEMLLKEIHHRVKNNLQVMSSLIGLQAGYIKRGVDIQSALKDMQNRIKSMAIVHERLYQSLDFSSINFKEYITSLTANVFQSLGIDSGRIRIIIQVEDVTMGINNAIPCGLLLNELLTNAVKHAFPGGRSGNVNVSMTREAGGSFRLSVKDDGVGLSESGIDIENSSSLGMNLIKILTKQIGGEISMKSGNGAEFIITFKDEVARPT